MNTVPTKRAYFCHFQYLQQTATENNCSVYNIDKSAQINVWLIVNLCHLDVRSESGSGLYPTIRREEPGGGDSNDDRGSGEYYSGEEFHEDDIMLTRDRYRDGLDLVHHWQHAHHTHLYTYCN